MRAAMVQSAKWLVFLFSLGGTCLAMGTSFFLPALIGRDVRQILPLFCLEAGVALAGPTMLAVIQCRRYGVRAVVTTTVFLVALSALMAIMLWALLGAGEVLWLGPLPLLFVLVPGTLVITLWPRQRILGHQQPPSGDGASTRIRDVKGLRNLSIVSALALLLLMSGWWACRELVLAHTERRYSRELIPGMTRQVVEDRLLSERIRFFPQSPAVDFVSAGYEVRYSLVCGAREVGLMLQFAVRDGKPSGMDVLQAVKPARLETGCL